MMCNAAGFALLFAFWMMADDLVAGFFLLLFMVVMTLIRWRFERFTKIQLTVWVDMVACALVAVFIWDYAVFALAMPIFTAMFRRNLPAFVAFVIFVVDFTPLLLAVLALSAVCGLFLGFWQQEREGLLKLQDETTGKLYHLQSLQSDLTAATARVEQMTAVAERTRIARDIHDNAGHEIVAAYITLQTARDMFEEASPDALELYDAALMRLDAGGKKIRDAVHNLSAVKVLGAETLQEICDNFTICPAVFKVFGDTGKVPMYVWNALETCLRECLTNAVRHARATQIMVNLDVTPKIIRLAIVNDGVYRQSSMGSGLRNLRHRISAVGGTLSVDADKKFRVVCVIPVKEEEIHEAANC